MQNIKDGVEKDAYIATLKILNQCYQFSSEEQISSMEEKNYQKWKRHIEEIDLLIDTVKFPIKKQQPLKEMILIIKLGAQIPIDYFRENSDFKNFIIKNKLAEKFFVSKNIVKHDEYKGALLPFELEKEKRSWIGYNEIVWQETNDGFLLCFENRIVCKTNKKKKFVDEYFVLLHGIVSENAFGEKEIRAYRSVNTDKYCLENVLDIVVNWDSIKNPSYFRKTHVYIELKCEDGTVRSIGQDIFEHVRNRSKKDFFQLKKRNSIISCPDQACYYVHGDRIEKRVSISLSREEHNTILSLIQKDRQQDETLSCLFKGNCASYVTRVLKKILHYHVKSDLVGVEVLAREFSPLEIDQMIVSVRKYLEKKSKWYLKLLYYLPPVIFLSFCLWIVSVIASICGYNDNEHFSLKDYIFRPWKIQCDIPRELYTQLKKHADDDGYIDRDKFPPGTIFQ